MATDPEVISDFLSEQREAAPEEFQQTFLDIEDYWERKLWHQLTDTLVTYFSNEESGAQRLPLFEKFIVTFAEKINQLKFVSLGLAAASQCSDEEKRLAFLQKLADKVDKPASQDAYVYALADVAEVKLRLEDNDGARMDLNKAEGILDTFDSVETQVHAAFYRRNADYYQATANFTAYYKNALLYLACIDIKSLTAPEAQRRAYNLSIAALVSEEIYNFGELLLHPILNSLINTQHTWLRDLLFAFNRGDLGAYNILKANPSRATILEQHKQFLYQKISLSALTEAIFRRPPHDRAMTFDTISEETQVQKEEIEHLLMKALSLGLLKGTIDQVDEVAKITWVQPKVLDMKQIDNMRLRLKGLGRERQSAWGTGSSQLARMFGLLKQKLIVDTPMYCSDLLR